MSDDTQLIVVQGKHCNLNVYVQGELAERHGKTVILTVHDVGTNHKSFVRFVNHPSMADVKQNAIFLHVCVPGQEDHAPDWTAGEYPTLAQLGEDLVCVLDKVDVRTCICFGEGAGANIICRFALFWPNRIMGIILVHCTSTTAGVIEYFKDKLINMRLENDVMTSGAWDYLVMHKFGSSDKQEKQKYIEELKATLNPKNLSKYLYSFSKRTDFSTVLGAKLDNMDALLVTGAKAPHIQTVYNTHKNMNKKKTTLLVVDNVSDVMAEAPENLARSLILLCKGCGVLSGVSIPGMERQRTLSSSMEEADRPRRFSVTHAQSAVTPPVAE
ncbi:ndr family domain-containing protein [Ditylenchus destructor]|uniref:Ndr family domain-containing protein n=1 Tax=Ditylenchus destructor TaxID=166010 RepID=A0AAD4RBR7_9BILA|nr:ndr family domain-containing protein [Ditylenchus destructor]